MAGRIVILGAGPTGLGAARRLSEVGHHDWDVVEASDHVGGLAASVHDDAGFTWDHGGHVMFSHYPYVDELVATMLGDDVCRHVRHATVWMQQRMVPFPLQHNVHRLPHDLYLRCLDELDELAARGEGERRRRAAGHFGEWLDAVFGATLVEAFMRPYNEKVWAHPLDTMAHDWQGERVPVVDVARLRANAAADRDDDGWGPNALFTFPAHGTGQLYDRIAAALPRPVRLRTAAVTIDVANKVVHLADGSSTGYDHLVSTMPLTELVAAVAGCPGDVRAAATTLRHTSGVFVGIGLLGDAPPERCWIYFPQDDVPFYRVTYLSNYSSAMTPGPGTSSLLAEISVSAHRPFSTDEAVERTVDGLVRCGLLTAEQCARGILSRHVTTVSHSYPVPTLDRDAALSTIHRYFEPLGIHSRGRFGAWRYEIGNTDHAVMMGVELADALTSGAPEVTWQPPT